MEMEFVGRTREEAIENALTKLKPFGGLFKDVYGEVYYLKAFYGDGEITTVVFAKPTTTYSGNYAVSLGGGHGIYYDKETGKIKK